MKEKDAKSLEAVTHTHTYTQLGLVNNRTRNKIEKDRLLRKIVCPFCAEKRLKQIKRIKHRKNSKINKK